MPSGTFAGRAPAGAERARRARRSPEPDLVKTSGGKRPLKGLPLCAAPSSFRHRGRSHMDRTPYTGETATQMHHARRGVITPEMHRVAEREEVAPETVRGEVARGRMVIPANVNHASLDPMGIGINARCKINANIGNSAITSNIEEELEKLHTAVHFGADTVMDLSTGGGIDEIRAAIVAASPVPIGTVPIYQVVQQVTRVEDMTADDLIDNIEHQAQQGVDYMTVHCG